MLFSKEYVGYLAREVSKKLVASGLIETKAVPALSEKVHAALLEELALEDRINDDHFDRRHLLLDLIADELAVSLAAAPTVLLVDPERDADGAARFQTQFLH